MSSSIKWLALLFICGTAHAGGAVLTWTPPTLNDDGSPLTDLASYDIWYGCNQSGVYDSVETVLAPASTYTVTGLSGTCYFAAKAVNSQGVSSVYSNEATRAFAATLPGAVTDTQITWQESLVMAIPVIESSSKGNSSGSDVNSISITNPSGIVSGDVMVLMAASDPGNPAATYFDPPTGAAFVEVLNYRTNNDVAYAVWIRDWDGTEGTIVVNLVGATTDEIAWAAVRLSGADGSAADVVGAKTDSAGGTSTLLIDDATTTAADTLAFYIAAFDGADGNPHSISGTGWSVTPPAGASFASRTSSSLGVASGWGTKSVASAGAIGQPTITFSATDGNSGALFAIAPGGAPPAGVGIPVAMHQYARLRNN